LKKNFKSVKNVRNNNKEMKLVVALCKVVASFKVVDKKAKTNHRAMSMLLQVKIKQEVVSLFLQVKTKHKLMPHLHLLGKPKKRVMAQLLQEVE